MAKSKKGNGKHNDGGHLVGEYLDNPLSPIDVARVLASIPYSERLQTVKMYFTGFEAYPDNTDNLTPIEKRKITKALNTLRPLLTITRTVKPIKDQKKLAAVWEQTHGIKPPKGIKVAIIPEPTKAKPVIKYKKITKKKKVKGKIKKVTEYAADIELADGGIRTAHFLFADYGLESDFSNLNDVLAQIENDAGEGRFSIMAGGHLLTDGGKKNARTGMTRGGDGIFTGTMDMVLARLWSMINAYTAKDQKRLPDFLLGLKFYAFRDVGIDSLNVISAQKKEVRQRHHRLLDDIKEINKKIYQLNDRIDKIKKTNKKFPAIIPDLIDDVRINNKNSKHNGMGIMDLIGESEKLARILITMKR